MIAFQQKTLLLAVAASATLLTACERPPTDGEQIGYRGTGMVDISNPRLAPKAEDIPAALPAVPQDGPRAGDVYQNVQVLGDLSVAEFTRTMAAITSWVAPEEGCNYCHNPQNLASDDLYTKVVSRRMMQMTRHINADWADHVGDTGVTCYSCHAGKPVPKNIWFAAEDTTPPGLLGNRPGDQNMANPQVGLTSLPGDPFSDLLTKEDGPAIRVQSTSFHPAPGGASIQKTEETYGLMMNISGALGVNCTYCHNTQSFGNWDQSRPQRVTAYHGLNMVQDLNQHYLIPLQSTFPENRLGPTGDSPKAFCATCHAGQAKPLGGAKMAADYPAFWQR